MIVSISIASIVLSAIVYLFLSTLEDKPLPQEHKTYNRFTPQGGRKAI